MAGTRAVSGKDLTGRIPGAVEAGGPGREEVLGEGGLLKQLTGRLLSGILEAETGGHSGCEKNSNTGDNSGDSRNGYGENTVPTENRSAVIKVPRDRNGTFEPKIIPKYEKRAPLFNGLIILMYGFGMSGRGIKAHPEQACQVEVPPELISLSDQCCYGRCDRAAQPDAGQRLCGGVFGRAACQRPAGR
ncbi:MAG: transposase [Spirochaetaceae bacterium]|jgi:transposase-like protein|nr:transposase [Spirochaetaceae bacterium]